MHLTPVMGLMVEDMSQRGPMGSPVGFPAKTTEAGGETERRAQPGIGNTSHPGNNISVLFLPLGVQLREICRRRRQPHIGKGTASQYECPSAVGAQYMVQRGEYGSEVYPDVLDPLFVGEFRDVGK
jgi:hypothetical protein